LHSFKKAIFLLNGATSNLMALIGWANAMCGRGVYNGMQRVDPEQILKKPRGSDCSLELGSMKEEWLVIANY
jgi:hypothetical protein